MGVKLGRLLCKDGFLTNALGRLADEPYLACSRSSWSAILSFSSMICSKLIWFVGLTPMGMLSTSTTDLEQGWSSRLVGGLAAD